jgi:hypothetical protein
MKFPVHSYSSETENRRIVQPNNFSPRRNEKQLQTGQNNKNNNPAVKHQSQQAITESQFGVQTTVNSNLNDPTNLKASQSELQQNIVSVKCQYIPGVANQEKMSPFDGLWTSLKITRTPVQRKQDLQVNKRKHDKEQNSQPLEIIQKTKRPKAGSIVQLDFEANKTALSFFRKEWIHQHNLNQKPILHFSGSTVIDTHQPFPNRQFVYQMPEPLFGKQKSQTLLLENEMGTELPNSGPGSYKGQQFPAWSGSKNLPSINHHSDKEEVPEKTRAAVFPSTSITHSTGSSDNKTFINSEKFKIQSTAEKQIQKYSTDTNPYAYQQGNKRVKVHQIEKSQEKDDGYTETHSMNLATFQTEELGSSYNQCDTHIVLNPSVAIPQLSEKGTSILQSQLINILGKFCSQIERIDCHSEAAKAIFEFHQRKSSLDKQTLFSHLNNIESALREFAQSQTMFASLWPNDQIVLLKNNTPLYIQYILARYFSAESGLEQFSWLMEGQISVRSIDEIQNMCYIGLREFNASTKLIQTEMMEELYKRQANNAANLCTFPQQCNGLIASLIIYR